MIPFHQNSISARRLCLVKIACVLTTLAAVTASASPPSFFKTTASALPIETIDSTGGKVSGHAYESSGRLYVSGHIQKSFGRHIPYAAHVDVQLVDKMGRVIAEKDADIDTSHPISGGSRSGQIPYVASFPLNEARQAVKIVVRYDLSSDGA
jgi:hypothetical protein